MIISTLYLSVNKKYEIMIKIKKIVKVLEKIEKKISNYLINQVLYL